MKITNLQGTVTLSNGVEMPYLGLGTFLMKNGAEVQNAVHWALEAGYKHIDTAAAYRNEDGVAKGIEESNLDREEVFITSKLWVSDQGYEQTKRAFEKTLKNLQTDYLDLYLIHWPAGGDYKESWRAFEDLYEEGRIKAIGVSNFKKHHLEEIFSSGRIKPMVNQMEFHPYLVQQDLIDFCTDHGIQYESWSPLMQGHAFEVGELEVIASNYKKSIAQLLIRYGLQKDIVMIPKSTHKERIEENKEVFDFEINEEDMQKLDAMDRGKRFGPDPDTFNLG
ncbi:MAG: aldo/keto reductase [Bacteroidales bacterium]|nr:aldo/keto reductase [Bacteroidales bacterium]